MKSNFTDLDLSVKFELPGRVDAGIRSRPKLGELAYSRGTPLSIENLGVGLTGTAEPGPAGPEPHLLVRASLPQPDLF